MKKLGKIHWKSKKFEYYKVYRLFLYVRAYFDKYSKDFTTVYTNGLAESRGRFLIYNTS